MSDVVIRVENISKQYRLGSVGTGSLAHDLNRTWHRVRGKEDPYLKIGEVNDRAVKGSSEYVWALQDINFDVKQGEVLGIIGRNGAGKSTLLKILSRTTTPTTGQIKIKGRVASLLEVGTGFHPELSGRENIFLNGAILGMTRHEIKSKFDEIVDFAGVERYIDTPVKRYSSGMYVRLAFGVAAHLEPEILIVDEVLAVGDAEFQKKALGKMKDVSTKEGRTVLFVSHNLTSIANLCNMGLLLSNGTVTLHGNIDDVISQYQISNHTVAIELDDYNRQGNGDWRINKLATVNDQGQVNDIFKLGDTMSIDIYMKNIKGREIEELRIVIGVYNINDEGYLRFDSKTTDGSLRLSENGSKITCQIQEHLNIKPDQYSLNIAIFDKNEMVDYVVGAGKFFVENFDYYGTGQTIQNPELSKVFLKHSWAIYD
ncbi:MAG: ABC transporter ATP-binding protein [Flavobacterium sp.]|nr:MAG: ABC transporter ATP-binding protein [Flavobacterium sp.]